MAKKIDYVDFCEKITFTLEAFYKQAKKDKEITMTNVQTFIEFILTRCLGKSEKEAEKIVRNNSFKLKKTNKPN